METTSTTNSSTLISSTFKIATSTKDYIKHTASSMMNIVASDLMESQGGVNTWMVVTIVIIVLVLLSALAAIFSFIVSRMYVDLPTYFRNYSQNTNQIVKVKLKHV